ncbi:MAG: acyl carrier protein [Pleurocapsa sp. MO_192.B19]|nr:acyl carrier protein [Pleurocapsa sp. MO_192.B19]
MELQNFSIANQPIVSVKQNCASEDDVYKLPTTTEIQAWIISYLAQMLEVNSDDIDIATPFDRYGLDSSAAVGMTGDLEDWLNVKLDPTLMYDYPTIEALTQYLVEEFQISKYPQ